MVGTAADLPLTETQYPIMASLIEPGHGYAVMQQVDDVTGGRVVIGPGIMYGTLKKLLQRKLIVQVARPGGNERRITYSLTAEGNRWVKQGRHHACVRPRRVSSLPWFRIASIISSIRWKWLPFQ